MLKRIALIAGAVSVAAIAYSARTGHAAIVSAHHPSKGQQTQQQQMTGGSDRTAPVGYAAADDQGSATKPATRPATRPTTRHAPPAKHPAPPPRQTVRPRH
jgi:hypothetical protein